MDWKNIIEQLVASGMSEQAIADELSRALPEPVRQPTINRLKNRRTTNPSYALGKALVDLHRAKVTAAGACQRGRRKAKPPNNPMPPL